MCLLFGRHKHLILLPCLCLRSLSGMWETVGLSENVDQENNPVEKLRSWQKSRRNLGLQYLFFVQIFFSMYFIEHGLCLPCIFLPCSLWLQPWTVWPWLISNPNRNRYYYKRLLENPILFQYSFFSSNGTKIMKSFKYIFTKRITSKFLSLASTCKVYSPFLLPFLPRGTMTS